MLAEVRHSGCRARSGPVSVAFAQVNGLDGPRVSFAVGRRVGKAVARNRLRRRLRAVMGDLRPSLAAGGYLVSAGPDAADLSPAELRDRLSRATRRAHVTAGRTSR